MRRLILVLSLLACTVSIGSPAVAEQGWMFGAHAGVGVPGGDFGDFWKTGFLVGGHIDCLLNSMWALGADLSYVKNDPSDDYQTELDLVGGDDEFTIIQYGVHAKWMLPMGGGPTMPYFVAGVGAANVKEDYSDPTFSEELTQTAFALRGGVGIDFKVTPAVALGAEVDYNHLITDEDEIGHDSAPYIGIKGRLSYLILKTP